jgi:hypothetical protein
MRRRLALPLLAALALIPTACTGQGVQAQELLNEAQQANAKLSSESFSARLKVSGEGQSASLVISGGVYLKGEHAGDGVVNVTMEGLATPYTMRIVENGQTGWIELNGQRIQTIPGSARRSSSSAGITDTLAHLDFERYVKDVTVSEHEVLNGESVTKVVGVLDTSAFIQDFGQDASSGSQQLPSQLQGLVPTVAKEFGDTRVVLFLSETSYLVESALVDLELHAQGKTVHMELDYGLTGVDKPIEIPE